MNIYQVKVPLESYSYQNQSDISQIPEEWIADDRCILCKYSKRSYPKLCRCYDCVSSTTDYYALGRRAEAAILQQYGRPVPPLRTGSLTRGKNKKLPSDSTLYNSLPDRHLHRHRKHNGVPPKISTSSATESTTAFDDRTPAKASSNRKWSFGTKRFSKQGSVESSGSLRMSELDDNSFFQSKQIIEDIPLVPAVIRNSKWNADNWVKGKFLNSIDPECLTLYDVFRRGKKLSNGGFCFGWRASRSRPFQWITYDEALRRSLNFGSGLIRMGLPADSSSLVGIFARNCLQWALAEQAIYSYSMVLVPLFAQLSPKAISYIIQETNMKVVICDRYDTINQILDIAPPCLKLIVEMDQTLPIIMRSDLTSRRSNSRHNKTKTLDRAASMNIQIVKFQDVERFGSGDSDVDADSGVGRKEERPPHPHSPAIICFNEIDTSLAISGKPKGVMLSHENIVACTSACVKQLGVDGHAPNKSDVMISYLPMAHMLERICQVSVLLGGGAIGFYSGDVHFLTEDMKLLQPTIVPAVPRFFNRLYNKVVTRLNRYNFTRVLFNFGLKKKSTEMASGVVRNDSLWDNLLFRWVVKNVAGLQRARLMFVGSAPLHGDILTFMRATVGCVIVEGYGQTECTAACTLSVQGDSATDHVGPPISCCVLKLVDVPELEYFAARGQGEICVRGSNVFLGYFKDPDKTRSVIDEDGWLHTGDIGQWLPNGTMKVIDVRKQIFKLSGGEYVDPERIESLYSKSEFIAQAYVHGDSLKSTVVAIIVPEIEAIRPWADARNIPSTSFSFLCNHPQINNVIQSEIKRIGEEENLKHFEAAAQIYLHQDLFSQQNGLLNYSGINNRKKLERYFKPQLEELCLKTKC